MQGTLRYAITNAEDGDTITFDASLQNATITLGGTQLEITKSITIDASNLWDDASQTPGITIDANQRSRVLYINAENVTVDGLAITNGKSQDGAGVYLKKKNAKLTNCSIVNNNATMYGGGCYIASTGSSFSNCTISGNVASYIGGGGSSDTGAFARLRTAQSAATYVWEMIILTFVEEESPFIKKQTPHLQDR